MSMYKGLAASTTRAVTSTMIAALILSASPLAAAPASAISPTPVASRGVTDFSAARRHRHYHRGGNAAGAAFMGMALGIIGGAIAAQQRRDYYENYGYYGYYYGPGYPYGGYPYGGPYYYGRPYGYPPY